MLLAPCAARISHLCSFLHWCLTLMYGHNPNSSTPFPNQMDLILSVTPCICRLNLQNISSFIFCQGLCLAICPNCERLGSWLFEIILHQKLLVFVLGVSFLKLCPWSEFKISGRPKVEKILISSPACNPSSCGWSGSGTASAHIV